MSSVKILVSILAIASVAVFSGGCARGGKSGAEARLGNSPSDRLASGQGSRYGQDSRYGQGVERQALAGTPQDLTASGDDLVYFSSDSAEISPELRQTLQTQVRWLQRFPAQSITIEGHADERGTREYNIALGAQRANAVKAYLISQGINTARIRSTSFGKERPIAVCNDISCWSRNRRSQTVMGGAASARL